jgi:hypothetical protein
MIYDGLKTHAFHPKEVEVTKEIRRWRPQKLEQSFIILACAPRVESVSWCVLSVMKGG